ncbi:uncharacterized protein LOC111716002 [Eurytemora carolleeae]|uniref:uncharacterized protein LOC111716002 n=1 Tax=Eurytemora carolleeae TaxID=1294199 RepID=UPI000C7857C1|nr:uncharacterized protein LOC111716002 [Eurytemora carolleeae]|eukprot:XP_023347179.1 uncharacterized protein LOC111716002 [Eurytemora affinis]
MLKPSSECLLLVFAVLLKLSDGVPLPQAMHGPFLPVNYGYPAVYGGMNSNRFNTGVDYAAGDFYPRYDSAPPKIVGVVGPFEKTENGGVAPVLPKQLNTQRCWMPPCMKRTWYK